MKFITKQIEFDNKDYFFVRDRELANYLVENDVMPITLAENKKGQPYALFRISDRFNEIFDEYQNNKIDRIG